MRFGLYEIADVVGREHITAIVLPGRAECESREGKVDERQAACGALQRDRCGDSGCEADKEADIQRRREEPVEHNAGSEDNCGPDQRRPPDGVAGRWLWTLCGGSAGHESL